MDFRNCLLSRKRKLAELFSVTATDDLTDYQRQLQAFQDANDLEQYVPCVLMPEDTLLQFAAFLGLCWAYTDPSQRTTVRRDHPATSKA